MANKRNVKSDREVFYSVLDALRIKRPIHEYQFHDERMWRFDYAWEDNMVALEQEGGIFINGAHSRGAGMKKDFLKYNAAALLGWRIIKCTPGDLCKTETIELIQSIII